METLHVLEQRITQLITLVKKLQDENTRLTNEHAKALQKLEALESLMLQDNRDLERLSNERRQTIHTIDELIKSIGILVGEEQQP